MTKSELIPELKKMLESFRDRIKTPVLVPGVDYLPPSGKVVGYDEFFSIVEAGADLWLTAGRFNDEFEEKLAQFCGLKKALFVNSGSSANLLALAALTSPKFGDRALRHGDEVLTAACSFPTTVSPSILYGLKPIFLDVELLTQNVSVESIKAALGPKTKAIMLAHSLGNPFRADLFAKVCKDHSLWLIEDCCDALGATIQGKPVGTFGISATCSFYPAHHITTGEGGAVLTNDSQMFSTVRSLRDWGRDCWCAPGVSDTCQRRFDWSLGSLPPGYDHKYIYANLGYNLKATDMQAAIGLVQLGKLRNFIEARRRNHQYLTQCLTDLGVDEFLNLPQATAETEPSWFGYFMTLKETGRRREVINYLESHKVGTRLLFGGNLVHQPGFSKVNYEVRGTLTNTDKIMKDGFWVGVWPGLEQSHLEYMASTIKAAVSTSVAKAA